MTEQNTAENIKTKGDITEAYTSALAHSADGMRQINELKGEDFTERDQKIYEAARKQGFGEGVAAGMQFVRGRSSKVDGMINEENKRLDEGELKNG